MYFLAHHFIPAQRDPAVDVANYSTGVYQKVWRAMTLRQRNYSNLVLCNYFISAYWRL